MEAFAKGVKVRESYIPEDAELKKYYNEISKYELLSVEEEKELFKTMHQWSKNEGQCGVRATIEGKKAREQIINSNLRLVIKISKEYCNMGLSLADLIAEGNMGLMAAVDKFKSNKKAKISTYASYWIKNSIFRAFDNKSRLIRVPCDASRKYSKVIKWMAKYEELTGEKPDISEIARKFKTTKARALSIIKAKQMPKSLDYEFPNDENESHQTFGDTIGDEAPSVRVVAEENDNKEVLSKLIDKLNEKEKYVLNNRFGLGRKKIQTLKEIGNKFSLTKERIRQIEMLALRKLRRMVQKEYKINSDSFDRGDFLLTKF